MVELEIEARDERTAVLAAPDVYAGARVVAWLRPVLGVFLWTRAAIWFVALFSFLVFQPNQSSSPISLTFGLAPKLTDDLGYLADVWARWTASGSCRSRTSARMNLQASAFYPLYPVLVGALRDVALRALRPRRDHRLAHRDAGIVRAPPPAGQPSHRQQQRP